MTDELIVIGNRPSNVYAPTGMPLTSDVYHIADRIKKLDKNLRIIVQPEFPETPFTVIEIGSDGVERFVKRYAELDDRIIKDLEYMLRVPFEHRMKVIADEVDAENERVNRMPEDVAERFHWEFLEEMKKANMVNPKWSNNPGGRIKVKRKKVN